jgi:hypothetical protein
VYLHTYVWVFSLTVTAFLQQRSSRESHQEVSPTHLTHFAQDILGVNGVRAGMRGVQLSRASGAQIRGECTGLPESLIVALPEQRAVSERTPQDGSPPHTYSAMSGSRALSPWQVMAGEEGGREPSSL